MYTGQVANSINSMRTRFALSLVFSSMMIATTAPRSSAITIQNFVGQYAPSNWTLTNTNTNGSVNTANAPRAIILKGGNNISISPIDGNTDYTTTAIQDGSVNFTWNARTLDDNFYWDKFGVLKNGIFTILTTDTLRTEKGSYSFNVVAGDIFGFRIANVDNYFQTSDVSSVTISKFSVSTSVPVPWETDAASLVGTTVIFGIGVWLKQKRSKRSLPVKPVLENNSGVS